LATDPVPVVTTWKLWVPRQYVLVSLALDDATPDPDADQPWEAWNCCDHDACR
jgi:hypothetical protein